MSYFHMSRKDGQGSWISISDVKLLLWVLVNNSCIWNLERWYWWSYLQGNNGHADIGDRLVDPVGEEEGGTNWENSMETCTLPHVKEVASANVVRDTGSSSQGSVTTWGRGMGREMGGRFKSEGTCVYPWLISVDIWQKAAQYCKAIIPQ